MPRHAELERILQAWFDFESCRTSEKGRYREALHEVLDAARAGSSVSRQEMIAALAERYREFRTAKERELKAKLSRLR
jgi:hypothetical protein